ncbi:GNAT family N-acetyltransferase [Colwellia sp. KU-HH00111]|uniref:GNAT family N-acetyltransferase n=1 Tax=Colwellia sp. KU-HH00111 TaxID=3127652 RepID=UPI0033658BC3
MLLENAWRTLTETKFYPTNYNNKESLQCFMSWEWLSQWLETYQDYIVELKIICVLYNDEYITIAPFYICSNNTWGITTKTLSFIATNEPEHCEVTSEFIDIAYSTEHIQKQEIIELLCSQLNKLTDITKFNFKDLNKQSVMYAVCQQLKLQAIAYEEHITGYQFYLNTTSAYQYSTSFLKKKKRILNKFEKISNTKQDQFIIANKESQALKLYDQLVDLHQKRWQQKNKPGVFSNNYFYDFHKNFIKKNFKKGKIVLSAIQIENQVISVNYSIKWHNILYFYQSGIDEHYKPNLSPGLLNHLLLIGYCKEHNIKQYNLLKSKQNDYKSQFSQQGDELINITMLSSNKLNWFWLAVYRAKLGLKHLLKLLR